jgi:hypothetical protein
MKRQLELNEYEVKDWCINCINVSEYYMENGDMAQAYYFLLVGIHVASQSTDEELIANLRM